MQSFILHPRADAAGFGGCRKLGSFNGISSLQRYHTVSSTYVFIHLFIFIFTCIVFSHLYASLCMHANTRFETVDSNY